jgi:hypothetical protein
MTAKLVRSVPTSDLSQVTSQVPAHRGPMVSMARRDPLVLRPGSAYDVRDRRSSVPGGNDPRPIVKVFVVSALGGGRILLLEARARTRSSRMQSIPERTIAACISRSLCFTAVAVTWFELHGDRLPGKS